MGMTLEEAVNKYIMPACRNVWNEETCEEIAEALDELELLATKKRFKLTPGEASALDVAIKALERKSCENAVSKSAIYKLTKDMYLKISNTEYDVHTISDCISYVAAKCRQYIDEHLDDLPAVQQYPCEDAISRKSIKHKLQEHHDFFVDAYGGFSNLPQNDKARVDEITNCIAMVVNEPPVTQQPRRR